jgi:hypothetical protein
MGKFTNAAPDDGTCKRLRPGHRRGSSKSVKFRHRHPDRGGSAGRTIGKQLPRGINAASHHPGSTRQPSRDIMQSVSRPGHDFSSPGFTLPYLWSEARTRQQHPDMRHPRQQLGADPTPIRNNQLTDLLGSNWIRFHLGGSRQPGHGFVAILGSHANRVIQSNDPDHLPISCIRD